MKEKKIMFTMDLRNETLAQQKQDVVIWAQKYGIESQVQEFQSNLANLQNQIKQNVTDLISELSTVLEQYYSIMENNDQTRMEQMGVLRNLSDQYPEAYDVLLFAFQLYMPDSFGPISGGDSVEVQWGPRIPNDIIPVRSTTPPGAFSPGGPPPLPDG
ncbi:hypothetical protein TELCIR_16997, partial [Teladorsagia circumcincta]